jgi:hypothetical protein
MADVGVGKRDDRQLENQNDAGDSPMHDSGTLCTAPPDPLPDLSGGETIMSDGDGGGASGGGSQLAQRAAVGHHLSDPDQGEGCSGGSDVSRGRDQNSAPTGHVHAVTPPQTVAPLRRNNFTLGPCEKRSRNPQNSKSPFFCRICQKKRPKGTLYVGFLPVGETRFDGWQQCCADVGGAGQGGISCATQFDHLLAAHGVLDAEERQLLEGGVTGAAASLAGAHAALCLSAH